MWIDDIITNNIIYKHIFNTIKRLSWGILFIIELWLDIVHCKVTARWFRLFVSKAVMLNMAVWGEAKGEVDVGCVSYTIKNYFFKNFGKI
jgi:hypothetical protein